MNIYEIYCEKHSQNIQAPTLLDAVKDFERENPGETVIFAESVKHRNEEQRSLATSLPPVEGVSDGEIDAMYPIEEDNIDGYYPSYELRKQVKAMRDKLQSHLSILSVENKELKDALAEEKAAGENWKNHALTYMQERDISYSQASELVTVSEKALSERDTARNQLLQSKSDVSDLTARLQQAEADYRRENLKRLAAERDLKASESVCKQLAEHSEIITKERDEARQSTGLQDHSHYNLSQMQGINDGECDIEKQLEKERNDPGEKTIEDQDHSLADNPAAEEAVNIMLNMASKLDTVFYQRIRMKEAHGEKITIDTFKNRYSLFKKDKEATTHTRKGDRDE